MQFKDIIIALLVIFSWSINLILQKIFSKQIPLEFFNLLRFVACVPLIFFFKKPAISIFQLLKISFFYNALTFLLVGLSLQYGTDVGVVSFIYQTSSFFAVLFCFLLLQEVPKIHQIAGMLLSFLGVGLLFSDSLFFNAHENNHFIAMLYVLFAAGSWGVGICLIKKYKLSCNLSTNVWITAVAAVPMIIMITIHGGSQIITESLSALNLEILLGVLYAAFVANILGNCLWFWLLKKYQSALITPFMLLLPPFSCVISYFLLDEQFSLLEVISFLIIIVGIAINQNVFKNERVRNLSLKISSIPNLNFKNLSFKNFSLKNLKAFITTPRG